MRKLEKKGDVCPLSRRRLRPSDLVTNHKLKWEINQWQLNYGEAYDELSRLESESKLAKATMFSQGYQTSAILRALTMEETAKAGPSETERVTTSDFLSCLDEVVDTVEATA
jgi:hypothetical protein